MMAELFPCDNKYLYRVNFNQWQGPGKTDHSGEKLDDVSNLHTKQQQCCIIGNEEGGE